MSTKDSKAGDKSLLGEGPDVMDADAAVAESGSKTVKVVRYNGLPFEVRQLTEADWSRAGVNHGTISWDSGNNWSVPVDQIDVPAEVFEAYITRDPKFSIEEVEQA